MYLWSIDMEAVLVAMSCFSLLCEEADIRGGSDEVTATFLLPNYHVYQELASGQPPTTDCCHHPRTCSHQTRQPSWNHSGSTSRLTGATP